MAIHTEVKKQKQAALEALKIKRGERTMDNASQMAKQLCNQFNEAFIRTIAQGEFTEMVDLKPLPKPAPKPKPVDDVIDMELLKTPEPEAIVVKGKIVKIEEDLPKLKKSKKKVNRKVKSNDKED